MIFFADRSLGKQFPAILRHAGLQVVRHDDRFAHDAKDEDWLREVGERGWIAITYDKRIRYKPNEIAAVERHDVRLIVLVGKAPFSELARSFVATQPVIERFVNAHKAPWIAKAYRASEPEREADSRASGSIELWYSK